jgi:hypothetical protein
MQFLIGQDIELQIFRSNTKLCLTHLITYLGVILLHLAIIAWGALSGAHAVKSACTRISVTRKYNKILPNFWNKVAQIPKYLHQILI